MFENNITHLIIITSKNVVLPQYLKSVKRICVANTTIYMAISKFLFNNELVSHTYYVVSRKFMPLFAGLCHRNFESKMHIYCPALGHYFYPRNLYTFA